MWLMQVYLNETSVAYKYIVFDNHPRRDLAYRFRTRIFGGEKPLYYNFWNFFLKYKRENQGDTIKIKIYLLVITISKSK